MNSRAFMKLLLLIPAAVLSASLCFASTAFSQLNSGQAKNLIRRVAGSDLPGSAVQIKKVTDGVDGKAETTAQIETAFRFQKDEAGHWEIREVRVAPDAWEEMNAIALGISSVSGDLCAEIEPAGGKGASVLNPKLARCLLARYLAIELPADEVRVREISPLDLPLSTKPSATVLATVQLDFRFERQSKGAWRVTEFRIGNRGWITIDQVILAIDSGKREKAKKEMEAIALALQNFRHQRGFYVASDQQRILVDLLTPSFMSEVVRLDPWHRPYQYQGARDRFTLTSNGPDGKPNTPDDIILTRP